MKVSCSFAITFLAMGFVVCPKAVADSFSWNFTTGGPDPTITGGSSVGNSYQFSASGTPLVTATAWYVNGGNLQKATVGRYSEGLGICNPNENCTTPDHQIDNKGQLEFMLFQFSQPLSQISFTIDPSPNYSSSYNGLIPDRDATFFAGSPVLDANLLTNTSFGTLASLFGSNQVDIMNDDGIGPITVNLNTSAPVSAVLFGAFSTLYSDDFFKIAAMAGSTSAPPNNVPEPSSIVLLGTMVAGTAYLIHKRRTAASSLQ